MRWQIPAFEWKQRELSYWIKSSIPTDPLGYQIWRAENEPNFLFHSIQFPEKSNWEKNEVIKEADLYLAGILKYFSKTNYQVGFPPDWLLDPSRNIRISAEKHWSQIPDDGPYDIKFVWEASRFSQIYTLVRAYARTQDNSYPQAFWQLISDWMESNPPGKGPNWKCGQEATLRLMALYFGYAAFKQHPLTTAENITQFTILVAALAERIYLNLGYAIYTRSNHTISESFGIWLAGTLFPEFKNAKKYQRIGKQILEREASVQIFPDGGYAMHSLNYHRFVLHIYLFAIRIGELNNQKLASSVYQAVERSLDYLSTLCDLQTGLVPQYGSNDGALVLPLNNCDYNDYRPLLQLGFYTLYKKRLLPAGEWDEDIFWFFGQEALDGAIEEKSQTVDELFINSGITKISGNNTKAFLRCGPLQDRPSHADQLHMDIWWQGINIALDAGTYLYSGEGHWRNGLARTQVHNTVSVDHLDQMEKFSRFIWVNWSQGDVLAFEEKDGVKYWQGQHDGYSRLKDPVFHKRTVVLLDDNNWFVIDHLQGYSEHQYTLNWLLDHNFSQKIDSGNILQLHSKSSVLNAQFGVLGSQTPMDIISADPSSSRGWVSHHYGHKEPAISLQLNIKSNQVVFWSYFGVAPINPFQESESLQIQSENWQLKLYSMNLHIHEMNNKPDITLNIQSDHIPGSEIT